MKMDGKDVKSDLHALKRLYGLVKRDGDEASNAGSDSLDESARLLLKNLLDKATERVLKSQVIAGEGDDERPTPHSSASVEGDQSCQKENRITSVGEKRCMLCRKNTVKSVGDMGRKSNASDLWSRVKEVRWLSSNNISDDSKSEKKPVPSDRMAKMRSSHMGTKEFDSLSQEASKAIQQIDVCMSALHKGEDLKTYVSETKPNYGSVQSVGTGFDEKNFKIRNNWLYEASDQRVMDDDSTEEVINQTYLPLSSYKLAQPRKAIEMDISEEEKCRVPTKKVNKIYVQNVNAIVEKIESGNWIMSADLLVPRNIALVPSEKSYVTPCWGASSSSNNETIYQDTIVMEDEQSKPLVTFKNLKNHPPTIIPEKLASKEKSHLLIGNKSDAQHRVGLQRGRDYRTDLQDQESDGTATDSYSNSSSQQSYSCGSNSEDYSVTDVTWSESSGSWDLPLSEGSGSEYSGYRSNSVYSSSSGEGDQEMTMSSSSGNEGYSSYEQPLPSYARHKYTSKMTGPSRIEKAYSTKRNKQSAGILKRMKDRLAVIFHHHHHHHHHHNHHSRGDRTKDEENMSHNSSLDKHKAKRGINSKSQDTHKEKAVEKIRENQIHEKGKRSHLHGLMGGLVKHVRHSKKPKKGKGNIDQLAREHGRKRNLKKSNWWQTLQHHGKSKLHDKAHAKLGLGKKKTHLKALPRI